MVPYGIRKVFFYSAGILIAGTISLLSATFAQASTFSWTSPSDPTIGEFRDSGPSSGLAYCDVENDTITVIPGNYSRSDACTTQRQGFKLSTVYYGAFISFGADSKAYLINGLPTLSSPDSLFVLPNTNTAVIRYPVYGGESNLRFYDNFTSRLTKNTDGSYQFDSSSPSYELQYAGGQPMSLSSPLAFSDNGRWIFTYSGNTPIRINTTTRTVAPVAGQQYSTSLWPSWNGDISNDGKYMASWSYHASEGELRMFEINDTCLQESPQYIQLSQSPSCPSKYFHPFVINSLKNMKVTYTVFSDDGKELTVGGGIRDQSSEWYGKVKFTTLAMPGYTPTPKLDYLALGDSISSGEGDTEVKTIIQPQPSVWSNPFGSTPIPLVTLDKYYRPYTDNEEDKSKGVPREKCHVSTRSYPYYLANQMKLTKDTWGSVACSGAKSSDVYTKEKGSNLSYKGQPKGGALVASDKEKARLEDYANRSQLQATALNEFIPGRAQQIEFVKKYKPKVITLTMGANNIDFGGKLTRCIALPDICGWVSSDKPTLGRLIQGQYDDLTSLYRELYDASGQQSKIFVLGYPKIMKEDNPSYCSNTLGLHLSERQMFIQATEYFNEVIERAAMATGARYVDISDALQSGRLCDDGQKYVTGVAQSGKSELQESFHPNDFGHIKIAQKIRAELGNKTPLEADVCADGRINCPDTSANAAKPAIPSEFGAPSKQAKDRQMTNEVMKKGQGTDLKSGQYSFEPNSPFSVTLHSDPIDLGTFTANNDGSINNSITIPATVPAGYHTIIVSGKTYSGEPIDLVQSVVVTGNDPSDLDENNTPDSQQACGLFIVASGADADMDGVDDACDPDISDTPQLYRARLGDSTRTYAGQAEKEHYIYIERNTRASSVTGVSGDSDPDSDGWAIVGASQGKQYSASSVPDTGPIAGLTVTGDGSAEHPYQPIVSIRAGGWGCVQYKPTSLSKVTASQSRTLTRVATNTNTCRQEAPGDDVDNNDQADDTQSLYLARQGDASKGEDTTRIYLYRNFYAAESQLGISDYTPTGAAANTIAALPLIPTIGNSPNHPIFGRAFEPIQRWNLLSVSKANEYIPSFNKLAIIEDSNGKPLPIVFTKKQNGQCIAYKPNNTDVIKFNQQNSLVKLTSVPEGVSCE